MYVARNTGWNLFLSEWRKRQLDDFHAVKFFGRKGRFARKMMTDSEHEAIFRHIVAAIGETVEYGVGLIITPSAYKTRLRKSPVSIYAHALISCMLLAQIKSEDHGLGNERAYIIDGGAPGYPDAARILSRFCQKDSMRARLGFGTFAPGDRKTFPQIQAADVYAYCLRESSENPESKHSGLFDLLWASKTVPHYYVAYNQRSDLEEYGKRLDRGLLELRKARWLRRRAKKLGEQGSQ